MALDLPVGLAPRDLAASNDATLWNISSRVQLVHAPFHTSIRNPDDISLPFPSPSSRFETKLGERRSPDFSFLFFFFLFIIFPAFNRDTSFPRDSNIALPG